MSADRNRQLGYGVAAQYSSSHAYVPPQNLEAFARCATATLGGTAAESTVVQVTPTPSRALIKPIFTAAGNIAAFAFTTPIPYPFGLERTGNLVSDIDSAIVSARSHGADVVVDVFPDAIERDAIIQWPGGVHMQLYCHTRAPDYPPLAVMPEYRVYVSLQSADGFVRSFVDWSYGEVMEDDAEAPGVEIGRPDVTFRRIRLYSSFGKHTVLATDGKLPYPFGCETTGYEVPHLEAALRHGAEVGLATLVPPFESEDRLAALVQFPGGFIAELHSFLLR